ncbi:protein NO VEIN domain-containing protein [Pseudomonas aeruginosa]|uniref:protein NO VEIN domain-containing protein n=1 Tax=Pseudomonas aeruginosa TaxID=287 RepID=UPI00383B9015
MLLIKDKKESPMSRKLALKRLTASDLTLFKWHFQNHPAGKQKAFNLDTAILAGRLYPQLGEPALVPQPRYPLDLYLCGPGLAPANNLQRKILKQQKNWRLNGELIDNPVESPELYNILVPGDFALFEFSGDVTPTTAKVVLISSVLPADVGIHAELAHRFPDGSMWVIEERLVQEVLVAAVPPPGHPLYDWAETSLLEDAALGGVAGTAAINARRGSRGISPEDFMRSRRNAEAIGVAGEELLNAWLEEEQRTERVRAFEWTASVNAVAPYDFRVTYPAGEVRVVDAKSTVGGFGNPIHLSLPELMVAVHGPEPYDIYRLYEVGEAGARMRVARNIGPSLRNILTTLNALPEGITVDGFSIRPECLDFLEEGITLVAASDEEL